MYLHGAANVHGGVNIPDRCSLPGDTNTNNIIEYEGCIMGLKVALNMRIKDLEAFKGSILIISQPT